MPANRVPANRSIRVCDGDREAAADVLGNAYAAGYLELTELEERSSVAYRARTVGDLDDLLADLPPAPRGGRAAAGGRSC